MFRETTATERPALARGAGARRARGRLQLWLSVVLACGLALEVHYFAYRHYERWDWTEQSFFTLSERSVAELSALDRDVDFYLFMSEAEPNFPEVKELLERYAAGSPHFANHFVDPDRDPSQFSMLAQRFEIGAGQTDSGQTMADVAAVLTSGDDKWTITRDDLVGLDFGTMDDDTGPKVDVKAEQAITGALVQLTSGHGSKVCIASGHGEWTTDAGSDRSLYSLADELRRDNVTLETVELLGGADVPETCDALFVIAPQHAFGEEEAQKIEAYLDAGGNALFALDPVLERDRVQPTGLEAVLSRHGVEVDASLVLELEPTRLLPPGNPAGPFLVTSYGDHPVTEPLRRTGGPALVVMARTVRPREGSDATSLLETSDHSWGETDLAGFDPREAPAADAADVPGPASIAVAVERAPPSGDEPEEGGVKRGRLIVIGDADFLQAAPLRDPRFTNLDLALAFTGWLTARDSMIAISAKQIDLAPMLITADDLGGLFFRLLVLMPGSMLLLGFAMWWTRRS